MAPKSPLKHAFTSTNQPTNNGRPRRLLSKINIELENEGFERVKKSQILEAFELLLNLPEYKVNEIATNIDYPLFLRMVAQKIMTEEATDYIEKILDRAHGKAEQKNQQDLTIHQPFILNFGADIDAQAEGSAQGYTVA